jgi:hypothetical protein
MYVCMYVCMYVWYAHMTYVMNTGTRVFVLLLDA